VFNNILVHSFYQRPISLKLLTSVEAELALLANENIFDRRFLMFFLKHIYCLVFIIATLPVYVYLLLISCHIDIQSA